VSYVLACLDARQAALALQYRRQALGGARDSRQWSSVETEEAPEAQDHLLGVVLLYCNVYSSFIRNCQNLEATKKPSVGECIKCSTFRPW
jgi:hypothetical protein